MRATDVAAVADIERRSQVNPWPESAFADELRRDWAYIDVARVHPAPALTGQDSAHPVTAAAGVAPSRPQVVGFCDYWLVADEVQLLNLVTDPDWRRQGIARCLMDALLCFASAHSCTVVTLEVRASNRAAHALYSGYGFREVAVRREYYADNREDALLMDLTLR